VIGYPSGQDGAIPPARDTGIVPQGKFGVLSHIINPHLTKLVRSRWLDIGLVFFAYFLPRLRLGHKHAKKANDLDLTLGQQPIFLDCSIIVSNRSILIKQDYYSLILTR